MNRFHWNSSSKIVLFYLAKNVEAKVNKRSNYKPKAGVASVDELKEMAASQAADGFLK